MSSAAADLVLVFVGLAGGLAVGSGMVAFLVVLDIIPRLAQVTRTFHRIHWYEGAVIAGSLFWSVADFAGLHLYAGRLGAAVFGALSGLFVGMLAAALTEVVNVLPILAKRLGMTAYTKRLLAAMVLGKVLGSLFDWLYYYR